MRGSDKVVAGVLTRCVPDGADPDTPLPELDWPSKTRPMEKDWDSSIQRCVNQEDLRGR